MKFYLTAFLLFFLHSTAIASEAKSSDPNYWSSLAKNISELIEKSEQQYKQGDIAQAKRTVVQAYFGVFEDKKMEAAMRMELGAKYTYKVEKKFGTMRKLMSKKAPANEVIQLSEDIQNTIQKDALKLDSAGIPPEVFLVNQ
jgi:hypothetical protein